MPLRFVRLIVGYKLVSHSRKNTATGTFDYRRRRCIRPARKEELQLVEGLEDETAN